MSKKQTSSYQAGTIIFQSLKRGIGFNRAVSLSGSQVLVENEFTNINHVALYVGDGWVIEASRQHGVIKRKLSAFLLAANYSITATINDSSLIAHALARANDCLGQPYNHSFYPDDPGFYCSQLIVHAFQTDLGDSYFQQYPMNFCEPTSQQFLPYWLDYYRHLGRDIPQGVQGSHPQQLLRQKSLFATIYLAAR